MMTETAWDASAILPDTSLVGRLLHTLIVYSDEPSALQVVAYVTTRAVIVVLTRAFGSRGAPGAKGRHAAAE